MNTVEEAPRQETSEHFVNKVEENELKKEDFVTVKSEEDEEAKGNVVSKQASEVFVSERVQLQNLPDYFSYKQLKSLLAKYVPLVI